ncbi:MAG TPA: lactate racemase domain-containing protein [Candidatus Sulfotelmatobacter sp.]|nr:lactate racemase domain-containing protein [Candidatus Sulfotelmatobacter sp.]
MVIGKGQSDRTLTEDELRELVSAATRELGVDGKRVLAIVPDGTRTMPMALMFELLQEEIGGRATACDYLVALGTHRPMTDDQLRHHFGRPIENGRCGSANIFNHRWEVEDTFAEIGTIPAEEVEQVSGKLLSEAISVRINRLIFEYDHVLICGPVFPHEVVGFSGGNKYLFPGISGKEMIDQTHWLGALLGSYHIIGTESTPVRELIDRAAAKIKVPVACMALVVGHEGVCGFYFGGAREAWKSAAALSAQTHIEWVEQPFRRALAIMPEMYTDMWTAAKGMYKAEPAMMDEGEVVIYAPHITEFSYTHGRQIESIGYHCRDYFLKQWKHFADVPRGVLAHSTHLRGQGAFDLTTGFERDRIRVTLATGISEERCRRMNLGYLNPREVQPEKWLGREAEGVKLMPHAGETLYRVKKTARS